MNDPTFSIQIPGSERMSDEEYQAMRQANIEYLESTYDFSSVEGINAIPGPCEEFKADEIKRDFTGRVEYYLLSKGEQYKKANNAELAIACFRKANELMPMYGDSFSRECFLRLPRYLRALRRFDEARAEEEKIQRLFGGNYRHINERYKPEQQKKQLLDWVALHKTDLVSTTYSHCCCTECAKYRGRVFSVSGDDARFPKLPEYLLFGGHGCNISVIPFLSGLSGLQTSDRKIITASKIIAYSNRPFIDDRTEEEVHNFIASCQEKADDVEREIARVDYDWLWEYAPHICPKSFSAYMRMKRMRSKKFIEIVSAAQELGREITL